ncbi:ADP-ribosylglycohydrolase family protein [Nostoc sp. CMAA1605]|uniref:ADP-ribosylglycohydrolase family protein n=1 Tax=Nostoc sp. CMAA1605 TaxID=2055159 RepID=UPI001F1593B7|nr:ADP-ribosylglycohydrolase family protein [Nostoc sp. CMAA1605]MCF4968156.1 hypothetical protein [Nostoc sp. CMAA1605]
MRYLLGSRFRGAFLGGLLGETLAKSSHPQHPAVSNFAESLVPGATSLVELGKFDLDNWLEIYQKKFTDLEPAKIIFATISLSLFCHENPVKLHQNLLQILKNCDINPEVRDSTLAIGYAIAQSLTEKLHPQTLIPQIIAFIGETTTPLPQNLLKVNNLLTKKAGLEILQCELNSQVQLSEGVALAFYYFLSTLEDFRLTLSRTIHHQQIWKHNAVINSQDISIIAAVLSGVYNSSVSIPASWRVSLTREFSQISPMLELADALAIAWSGVYKSGLNPGLNLPEFPQEENFTPCVYAAPRVIKAR